MTLADCVKIFAYQTLFHDILLILSSEFQEARKNSLGGLSSIHQREYMIA